MNYKYEITGSVNNEEVKGIGRGAINPAEGISELEVSFVSRPMGWDPRTIILMCCDRAYAMGAFEHDGAKNLLTASGGYLTIGRHLDNVCRDAAVRDITGKLYAHVRASSETRIVGDEAYDSSRIEGGFSQLVPGVSGIKSIRSVSGMMMQAGPNVVNIMTNYELISENGTTLYGFTFYPHFLPDQIITLDRPQLFELEVLEQEFKNERLYLKTYTAVSVFNEERFSQLQTGDLNYESGLIGRRHVTPREVSKRSMII